jgi:hypothetical protein
MAFNAGNPFKGEVDNANAGGAGAAVTLYLQGAATAYTMASDERLNVTDVVFISAAGGAFSLNFAATDVAGTKVCAGTVDAKGGVAHHFETPISGPLGTGLTLLAAAGQIDLVVAGYLTKG